MWSHPKVNPSYHINMMGQVMAKPIAYQQMLMTAELDCIVRKIPVTWLFKQHEYGAI